MPQTAKRTVTATDAMPAGGQLGSVGLAFAKLVSDFREFVAPRYRPELHYMRGPGPAYARRAIMVESDTFAQIAQGRRPSSRSDHSK